MKWDMEEFIESCWAKYNYVFYHPKKDQIVLVEFQRWVDEGNKIMASIHNRERYMRKDLFLKQFEFIGEM